MDVRLHIERIVLDGFSLTPAERAAFVTATEAELTRLVVEGGLSEAAASGLAIPSLNASAVQLPAPIHPEAFGHEVARALYSGIGRPKP